eukprot:scaffold468705_cov36-Prasinocladus_malaysianus.AAC.1
MCSCVHYALLFIGFFPKEDDLDTARHGRIESNSAAALAKLRCGCIEHRAPCPLHITPALCRVCPFLAAIHVARATFPSKLCSAYANICKTNLFGFMPRPPGVT